MSELALAVLIAVAMFASKTASAQDMAPARSSPCEKCTPTQIAKKLHALDFNKRVDRTVGRRLVSEAITKLKSSKGNPNDDSFQAVLEMVREAEPYDGESQAAEILVNETKDSHEMSNAIKNFMADQPSASLSDRCKNKKFQAVLKESACHIEKGTSDPACVVKFSFDSCIAGK